MTEIHHPVRLHAPSVITASSINLNEPQCIVLPNGIPVYSFPDLSQQALRFDLILDAGSAIQQKLLVASTTASMIKEGSTKYSATSIHKRIDYHGAYLDTQSTRDYTSISLFCLAKSLQYLLPILESILKEPLFKQRDFDVFNLRQKEQFLVSNQKNKHVANRIYTKKLYGEGTPYGQVAEENDFDKLQTSDLKSYHSQHFHPANCSIIISGPVNEKTLKEIEQYFGDQWSLKKKQTDFEQNTLFNPGLHQVDKPGSLQSAIMMGKPMIHRTHPDYFGVLVMNTILGGYFGSRLMANIREDKGYTYGIHSQIAPLRKTSSFMISTEVGTSATKNTLAEINNELNRMRTELVGEDELNLVKNYLAGSYMRGLDGVYNQAEKFRATLDNQLGMAYFANSLKAISSATSEEIKELAVKYLDPDSMLTVVVGNLEVTRS
ncbi:MAG: hypothetical protein CVT92_12090 [Bacteroidetes bacterium HGW-Bacteroidetes-1]|jgi:predicted Zn-dependent peptidase|nr:MAG: hypothetical protein CVT92_12090 [Bacteroidetes bacterium HGW-Bacteroidetes-1]